jgi:hypothetical protein
MEGSRKFNEWRLQNREVPPELREANLGRVNLSGAQLWDADFTGANVARANLRWGNFTDANLSKADLREADLTGANLIGANLKEANLSRANLAGANFMQAHLWGSNLSEADLVDANFTDAGLDGANFAGAMFGRTIIAFQDLRGVKGLESVRHRGPSSIGIETIYASKGEIPEVFLRGAGVPDSFITFAKSLVGKPFDFYSCFISHSSVDQEFAERLYADLQAKGVRCWYAPEDLKIGDKFRTSIDEAIRIHDKLLIILSENSVRSTWVETEVETAFERERREDRTVLFPIRIDDAVMETGAAWAAEIHRTRQIGDFSNWKDHDSYQKAFDRLLRDLKSDARPTTAD